MKQTITQSQFIDAFRNMNREDQFTYQGKCALYDYLEDLYESIGEDYDLDVIALCCEYSEYTSFKYLQECYDGIKTMDDLRDHTTVIPIDGDTFIIQDY